MGVRLYPITRNVANLEKLCGVPEGTHARLEALKVKHGTETPGLTFWEREGRYEALWNEVNADPHTATLDHFITFGWGKFGDMHDITGGTCGGSETDPVRATMLLRSNGLHPDLALCEGVCWG
jgi:hypothetical protein